MDKYKDKLWGGRFDNAESKLMEKFNCSLPFDRRLFYEDITGSIAHCKMLGKAGILTEEETEILVLELLNILSDIEDGVLEVEGDFEDIHSFVEIELTDRVGEVGKKLHTARSRNDQVALDMRMFAKKSAHDVINKLEMLCDVITKVADDNNYIMPGYTHLQRAQVVTFKYYLMAYFEKFSRDITRLENAIDIMDESPLGAGALAGTTHNIDRNMTSSLLGFKYPVSNFMDAISDRDYILELMNCFSMIMLHMSRISEEFILFSSQEFNFITIGPEFSTGSSIMPQKKNPDGAELIRGKTGRVFGDQIGFLVTMKGLSLCYNKDMQEDKEAFFDSLDTVSDCIEILTGMVDTITVNEDNLLKACKNGFLNATEVADYLVSKGVPFREAHGIVGEIVIYGEKNKVAIEDIELDVLQSYNDLIEEDIYDYIDYFNILNKGIKKEIIK